MTESLGIIIGKNFTFFLPCNYGRVFIYSSFNLHQFFFHKNKWCVLLGCICKTKLAKRTQMLLSILFLAIQIINNVSLY